MTARPHPLAFVGVLVGAGWFGWLAADGLRSDATVRDALGALGLVIIAVIFVASAARHRVEVDGDQLRVVRLWSTDEVRRADVVSVHRAGGRGKPAFIELTGASSVPGRSFELTRWPPSGPRTPGTLGCPDLLSPTRVARALDVPLVSWSGEPSGRSEAVVSFRGPTTFEGAATWMLTLGLVAGLALLAYLAWSLAFG